MISQPRSACFYRLSGAQAEFAASLDGTRTVAELAAAADAGGLEDGESEKLVEFLRRLGCLLQPSTDVFVALNQRCARARESRLSRAVTKVRAPTVTVRGVPTLTDVVYRHGGRWLFTPAALPVLVLIIVVGLVLTITQRHHFTVLGQPTATTAATVWLLILIAGIAHELAHALAIRHAGRRILGAGFGLYLGNPVLFINSSDMVMAAPRARAVNAAAGPVASLVIAGMAGIVAAVVGPSTVGEISYRMAVLTFVLVAVNLLPFLELDGYWLITDLLDVPDLRPRALAFLRQELVPRLRSGPPLNRGEWGLVGFGVAGSVATAGALVLAAVFWWPILTAVTAGLWRGGWPGQCVLLLLAVLVAAPLTAFLYGLAARCWRWATTRRDAVRFRLQQRWRVAAAELVAALPQVIRIEEAELGELAGRVVRRKFATGDILLRQGDPAVAFQVLRRGHCTVAIIDGAGDEMVTARLGPGDAFGDLALRERTVQQITVRAESDGELFVIDAGTFLRLLNGRLAPSPVPSQWAITRVRSLPPFRDLGLAALTDFARVGVWLDVPPGAVVGDADDAVTTLFVVASGQLDAAVGGRSVGTFRIGDFFTAKRSPAGPLRGDTVRALTPVRLLGLPRAAAERLLPDPLNSRPPAGHPHGSKPATHMRDRP